MEGYLLEITSVSVFHDDVETLMFNEGGIVTDDGIMSHASQDLRLLERFLLVLLVHVFDVDLLHHVLFLVNVRYHFVYNAKRTSPELLRNGEVTHACAYCSLVLFQLISVLVNVYTVHHTVPLLLRSLRNC